MRAVFAAVVLVLALASCELRTEINVDVAEDGSGTVEVGAGVDDDALDRAGAVLGLSLIHISEPTRPY